MTEEQKPENKEAGKSNNMLVIGIVVAIFVIAGGYFFYQKSQSESVSIKLGDKELSATIR